MRLVFELLTLVLLSIVPIPLLFAVLLMLILSSMKSNGLKIIRKSFVKIYLLIYISIESNGMIQVYTLVVLRIVFITIKQTMVQVVLKL